jgi:ectoine hydroxylase-related dioxygenase (phytanoyl-CoA dioxygenase family)
MRIDVNSIEYVERRFEEENLMAAVHAIHKDGYVVLGGVVDLDELDALKPKLEEDTIELFHRIGPENAKDNYLGHLSQAMPRSKEHIFRDIVTNPFVIQVTSYILGPGVHNHFYNCNTNMPGSGRQPLHRDAPHLGWDPVNVITSIIVNISLIDVDLTNGATELWPGTHRLPGSTRIQEKEELKFRETNPPVYMLSKKGDAVLRDPRMWHRGVSNNSTIPRHMIAMVHSRSYYMKDTTIPVTKAALHSFDHEILTTKVSEVPDDYDYLSENLT